MKITKTDISKLRKQTLRTYLYAVCEMVAVHDSSAPNIEEFYNKLNDLKPTLDSLNVKFVPACANTAKLKLTVRQLKNVMRSINLQLQSAKRMSYVGKTAELDVIDEIVARYIKLALKSNPAPTENICARMLKELADNANMQMAIESLGLKLHFDELQRLIGEAEQLRKAIVATIKTREFSITADLRKQMALALTNLFMAIELENRRGPAGNYLSLINSLNVLNGQYRAIQKAQATRSKSILAKKEATNTSSSQTNANVA
jgi:hypothetical protein